MIAKSQALQKLKNHFMVKDLKATIRSQVVLKEEQPKEYFDDMAKFFDGSDYDEIFFAYETLEYLAKCVGLSYEEYQEVIAFTLGKNMKLLKKQFQSNDKKVIQTLQALYLEYFGKEINETELVKLVSTTIINLDNYVNENGRITFIGNKEKKEGESLLSNLLLPIKINQIEILIYTEEEYKRVHAKEFLVAKARENVFSSDTNDLYIEALTFIYAENIPDEEARDKVARLLNMIDYLLLQYNDLNSETKLLYKSLIDYTFNDIKNLMHTSDDVTRKIN